jgi:hypothetical protein
MSFFSWLRNRASIRSPRGRPQHQPTALRFRPQLEVLEGRALPSANTLTVTNLYDSGPGSLRYEIAQVTSKDNTIVFAKKLGGTITLTTGELVISKSLTIEGGNRVTITSQPWVDMAFESNNGSRIFEVDGAGTTVTLSGLTMTNGGGTRVGGGYSTSPNDGYGGAILNFGTLTLSNCSLGTGDIASGSDAQYGGAIANFGVMMVSGCYVQNNFVYGAWEGGGIYNAGTLTVSNSHVWYNTGGSGIFNTGTAAALTVSNSYFSHNTPDNIFGLYTDAGGNTFS